MNTLNNKANLKEIGQTDMKFKIIFWLLYLSIIMASCNGDLTSEEWNEKGVNFFMQNQYHEAIEAFDKAIDLEPNYATAWNNKGIVLLHQGDAEDDPDEEYLQANESFAVAIRISPSYSDAWLNMGAVLNRLGKYEEALKACNESIRLNPNASDAWYNKANALTYMSKFQEATDTLNKGIGLSQNHPRLWHAKGLIFEASGRLDQAALSYKKSVDKDPNFIEGRISLISVLKKAGRYDEADTEYYEYKLKNKGWNISENLWWILCGFGVSWCNTIIFAAAIWAIFSLVYIYISSLRKESLAFSAIALFSLPRESFPYAQKYDQILESSTVIRFLFSIERLIGWSLLIIFINTVSRVNIHY
ncbi:MAG: tetratricopeptide repeat protein [Methanothrix sp.]|nr:tetratricopeptide repeat protein [Methanothrix sp.]